MTNFHKNVMFLICGLSFSLKIYGTPAPLPVGATDKTLKQTNTSAPLPVGTTDKTLKRTNTPVKKVDYPCINISNTSKDTMELWVQAGGRQLGELKKVIDIAPSGVFEWLGAGAFSYGKVDALDLYAVYRNPNRSIRAQYYMKFKRWSNDKFTLMPRQSHTAPQWKFMHCQRIWKNFSRGHWTSVNSTVVKDKPFWNAAARQIPIAKKNQGGQGLEMWWKEGSDAKQVPYFINLKLVE